MTEITKNIEKNRKRHERRNISSTPVEEKITPYNLEIQTTVSKEEYWNVIRHKHDEIGGYLIWFKNGNTMYVNDKFFVSWRKIITS